MTESTLAQSARVALWAGSRDTFPMLVGAAPFGIIFGALAVGNGLSPLATLAMSLFVYAGSSQFIAASLLAQGTGLVVIIFTTFIVNIRHMLYGASLSQHFSHLSQRWLLPLGFWLTDETYATVYRHIETQSDDKHLRWYALGSSLAMYLNWQLWTLIGIVAGTQLQGLAEWGLDVAMSVTFIGIVVPLIRSRPMLVCACISGVVALIAKPLPNNLGLLVAALVGISAGVGMEVWRERRA